MKICIIGGSGLDDPDIVKDLQNQYLETPYGETKIKFGKLNSIDVIFVPDTASAISTVQPISITGPTSKPSRI